MKSPTMVDAEYCIRTSGASQQRKSEALAAVEEADAYLAELDAEVQEASEALESARRYARTFGVDAKAVLDSATKRFHAALDKRRNQANTYDQQLEELVVGPRRAAGSSMFAKFSTHNAANFD